jgi:hypothetical protein
MANIALPVTTFQLANGAPVANGFLRIRLNRQGQVTYTPESGPVTNIQINPIFTEIPLNAEGVITGTPTFWQNSSILPTGTYYILQVFASTGQIVAGPNKVTV